MECQMLVKGGHAQKFLERRFFHSSGVAEAHMIIDECQNLLRIATGKTQPMANFFRYLHSDVDMVVEANAIRRHAKCCRFAYVVQERTPGQSRRAWLRQMIEQQERVDEHISLGMKLRRL